jgi:ribonuclease P protein component
MNANAKLAFKRSSCLKGKKNIETLLHKGEAFFVFPYRVVYNIVDQPQIITTTPPIKYAFTASKKKFKKAVDRNKIKRISKYVGLIRLLYKH